MELTLITVGVCTFLFLAGLWIGVGLGKRSERAKAIYDGTRAKTDRLVDQVQDKYDETASKIRDRLDD